MSAIELSGTGLTERTFARISKIRDDLILASPNWNCEGSVAGIFSPWRGAEIDRGGLYYVGIATNGAYYADEEQSLDACLSRAALIAAGEASLEVGEKDSTGHSAFWRFLNQLTMSLLRGSYKETASRWGWSNLLKIGWSHGAPASWPKPLITGQREACRSAFAEETSTLRDCLVIVASSEDFGCLDDLKARGSWQKDLRDPHDLDWWFDQEKGSLWIHSNHPNHMRGRLPYVAQATVKLAQAKLTWAAN